MGTRERYDPEDIESLLRERGFDELLAEERAFVLRHLSGREEYESMRALLAEVRRAGWQGPEVHADPRVKEKVLAAFREHHRPSWRIWLNTVSAWIASLQARPLWRPALAVAGTALLITVAIVAVQRFGDAGTGQGLAEVKRPEVPQPQALPAPPAPGKSALEEARDDRDLLRIPDSAGSFGMHTAQGGVERTTSVPPDATPVNNSRPGASQTLREAAGSTATVQAEPAGHAADVPEAGTAEHRQEALHDVTADELMENMSLANAKGQVARATERERQARKGKDGYWKLPASRSLAQDTALAELIVAGW